MLKKISSVITGFLILFSLFSCEKSDSKTKSSSKYSKSDIIGEWYSGEIGGSFYFDEDNNFSLRVDVTDVMYIDSKGISHITGSDDDYSDYCNYDGQENRLNKIKNPVMTDDIFLSMFYSPEFVSSTFL